MPLKRSSMALILTGRFLSEGDPEGGGGTRGYGLPKTLKIGKIWHISRYVMKSKQLSSISKHLLRLFKIIAGT